MIRRGSGCVVIHDSRITNHECIHDCLIFIVFDSRLVIHDARFGFDVNTEGRRLVSCQSALELGWPRFSGCLIRSFTIPSPPTFFPLSSTSFLSSSPSSPSSSPSTFSLRLPPNRSYLIVHHITLSLSIHLRIVCISRRSSHPQGSVIHRDIFTDFFVRRPLHCHHHSACLFTPLARRVRSCFPILTASPLSRHRLRDTVHLAYSS